MADSNAVFELASTLQSAHINHDPDPTYDLNPSTAASKTSPVRFRSHRKPSATSSDPDSLTPSDEIPLSVLEAPPRKTNLPPLPDLRFEQSYLARIAPYSHPENGGPPQYFMIAWLTVFDHFILPLSQGLLWNLMVHGWRSWNTAAAFRGKGVGARVRRWWWGVNGWGMPTESAFGGLKAKMAGVNLKSQKTARQAAEFFENEFGSAGMD